MIFYQITPPIKLSLKIFLTTQRCWEDHLKVPVKHKSHSCRLLSFVWFFQLPLACNSAQSSSANPSPCTGMYFIFSTDTFWSAYYSFETHHPHPDVTGSSAKPAAHWPPVCPNWGGAAIHVNFICSGRSSSASISCSGVAHCIPNSQFSCWKLT